MTREEEIQREADSRWLHDSANNQRFVEACKWADQNPKKGLWDSEKVCNFIEENIDNYLYTNRDWNAPQIKSNFIEDLRKAMEK